MAGSLNRVTLIGNVGKDPEIRTTTNGNRLATFSLAMSETWKDKDSGEKRERTEWANIVVFNEGLVDVVEKYVKKGSKLYVEGAFATRKWKDKDDNDRWSTEVVLKAFNGTIVLLGGKSEGGGSSDRSYDSYEDEGRPKGNSKSAGSGGGRSSARDLDDEIPF